MPTTPVGLLAMARDGSLVFRAVERRIDAFDARTGARVASLVVDGRPPTALFAAPGGWLHAISRDGVHGWDPTTGAQTAVPLEAGQLRGRVDLPDGTARLLSLQGSVCTVLDLATGEPLGRVRVGDVELSEAMLSAGGERLLALDADDTLHVWDVQRGALLASWPESTYAGGSEAPRAVEIDPLGRWVLSTTLADTYLWDVERGAYRWQVEGPSPDLSLCLPSSDGRFAVLRGHGHALEAWDLDRGQRARSFLSVRTRAEVAELSADDRTLVVSDDEGRGFWAIDVGTARVVASVDRHLSPLRGLLVSADGRRVLTRAADGAMVTWDAATGAPLARVDEAPGRPALDGDVPPIERVRASFVTRLEGMYSGYRAASRSGDGDAEEYRDEARWIEGYLDLVRALEVPAERSRGELWDRLAAMVDEARGNGAWMAPRAVRAEIAELRGRADEAPRPRAPAAPARAPEPARRPPAPRPPSPIAPAASKPAPRPPPAGTPRTPPRPTPRAPTPAAPRPQPAAPGPTPPSRPTSPSATPVATVDRVRLTLPSPGGELELPLRLLLLGDYTGRADPTPLRERPTTSVTTKTLDRAMAELAPSASFEVPNLLGLPGVTGPTLAVDLHPVALADLGPDAVAREVPALRALVELRRALTAIKAPMGCLPPFTRRLRAYVEHPPTLRRLCEEIGVPAPPPVTSSARSPREVLEPIADDRRTAERAARKERLARLVEDGTLDDRAAAAADPATPPPELFEVSSDFPKLVAGNPGLAHLRSAHPDWLSRLHPECAEEVLRAARVAPAERLLAEAAAAPEEALRALAARDGRAPAEVVVALARDPSMSVRRALAANPSLPRPDVPHAVLEALGRDVVSVRNILLGNPRLPPEVRASIVEQNRAAWAASPDSACLPLRR